MSFGIRMIVASQNEFGSVPSSAIFWDSLGRIGDNSSLNVLSEFTLKPSGPRLQFIENFLITDSTSVLVIGLLLFFFFPSRFSLERLYLYKHLSISSRLSTLLAYINSCL